MEVVLPQSMQNIIVKSLGCFIQLLLTIPRELISTKEKKWFKIYFILKNAVFFGEFEALDCPYGHSFR